MKRLLSLLLLSLLLSACGHKSAPQENRENARYARIGLDSGSLKLEFLDALPENQDPDDIVFIKVTPGTVTVGTIRSINEEKYFIMTKPVTKKQLSKLIGTEPGDDIASETPFASIEQAMQKLTKANPDMVFSIPKARQWDFAFLSGKINENDQPICWEWAVMNNSDAYTWRGRIWHIMEMYEEAEKERSTDTIKSDLSFRFVFREKAAK